MLMAETGSLVTVLNALVVAKVCMSVVSFASFVDIEAASLLVVIPCLSDVVVFTVEGPSVIASKIIVVFDSVSFAVVIAAAVVIVVIFFVVLVGLSVVEIFIDSGSLFVVLLVNFGVVVCCFIGSAGFIGVLVSFSAFSMVANCCLVDFTGFSFVFDNFPNVVTLDML